MVYIALSTPTLGVVAVPTGLVASALSRARGREPGGVGWAGRCRAAAPHLDRATAGRANGDRTSLVPMDLDYYGDRCRQMDLQRKSE